MMLIFYRKPSHCFLSVDLWNETLEIRVDNEGMLIQRHEVVEMQHASFFGHSIHLCDIVVPIAALAMLHQYRLRGEMAKALATEVLHIVVLGNITDEAAEIIYPRVMAIPMKEFHDNLTLQLAHVFGIAGASSIIVKREDVA